MATQLVGFRKRISDLQYELRESRSMEKRLFHVKNYQSIDYEKFTPALTINRIEEINERE
jgi:hypothetical protein